MRAHELLAGISHEDADYQQIMTAVKFDMGSSEAVETLFSASTGSFPGLPAPQCLFEVEVNGETQFHLAREVKGVIVWTLFAKTSSRILKSSFLLGVRTDTGWKYIFEEGAGIVSYAGLSEEVKGAVQSMLTMARAVEVFSCCNVITKENPPPAHINEKRVKKGKIPFFTYKTLHISSDNQEVTPSGLAHTHSAPRLHLRRGHIRRLPDKKIWVRASLVGDKSKGLVMKDYKVT